MKEYHKINSVFKRDMESNGKRMLEGVFSTPEIEFLKDNTWEFTEKLDGTNVRVMVADGKVSYGGKTDNASMPIKLMEALRARFDHQAEALNEEFPGGACLYGEGCGPKIQKGGERYGATDFILFDVRVGPWWLRRKDVQAVAARLGLQFAPVIGEGTIADLVALVKGGVTSRWGDFPAEGIVARPKTELVDRAGHRIITKLKTKDFL